MGVYGTDLLVGGDFTTAGGLASAKFAKWDGGSWVTLAGGVAGAGQNVHAIGVSGSNVYVGGEFTTADGNPANTLAVRSRRWQTES